MSEADAARLLTRVEQRVAFLVEQSRQTVEHFFGQPSPAAGPTPDAAGEKRPLRGADIDRFARQWRALVPNAPDLRAELGHALAEHYSVSYADARGIRDALGLDDAAVCAAHVRLYALPPEAVFVAPERETTGPQSVVEAVEADLEWVSLLAGEVLFRQGDPGDGLYLVVNGRLRIVAELPDGSRSALGDSGRGEMVGEMALLTGQPRSATVEAVRDTDLVRLSRDRFDRLVEQHPTSMMQIARMLVLRQQSRASQRQRTVRAATVAVVPRGPRVPHSVFSERLAAALARFGPTLHLSAERLDALLEPGAAQTPRESPDHSRIVASLSAHEAVHAYVVYEADPDPSHWTRRCVRQADRVLIVADATHSPAPAVIERELAAEHVMAHDLVLLHRDRQRPPRLTADWLATRSQVDHHHVSVDTSADFDRLARRLTGRAVGLVLGGGGARGYTHLGVIQALREAQIPIDAVGGTSIGALLAAECALEWDDRTMRAVGRRYAVEQPPSPNVTLPFVALSTGESMSRLLREVFGDAKIEDLWIPYYAVSSDLTSGDVVVHRGGSLARALRASMSVPGILPPVAYNGRLLIDGGVLNNLPTDVMQKLQGGIVIAVDCNPSEDMPARADYGETLTARQIVGSRLNPFVPTVNVVGIHAILDRMTMLSSIRHATEIARSVDLYIHPPTDGVNMYDSRSFEQSVARGYSYTAPIVQAWKQQLAAEGAAI